VPGLRRFITDVLPRRLGFDPRPVHGGFVVENVVLGQDILLISGNTACCYEEGKENKKNTSIISEGLQAAI
jgi:hypothetical protein